MGYIFCLFQLIVKAHICEKGLCALCILGRAILKKINKEKLFESSEICKSVLANILIQIVVSLKKVTDLNKLQKCSGKKHYSAIFLRLRIKYILFSSLSQFFAAFCWFLDIEDTLTIEKIAYLPNNFDIIL